jgi:hypothetical protein
MGFSVSEATNARFIRNSRGDRLPAFFFVFLVVADFVFELDVFELEAELLLCELCAFACEDDEFCANEPAGSTVPQQTAAKLIRMTKERRT